MVFQCFCDYGFLMVGVAMVFLKVFVTIIFLWFCNLGFLMVFWLWFL